MTSRESPNLSGVNPPLGELVEALGDELEDRSIGHRAGERSRRRGVDDLVVLRERGVDVGWVGVAVVVMRCATLRAP